MIALVAVASCSLISDDDEPDIDPDQSFCGELDAEMSQYEVPITMQDMAEIYSSIEAPEGLESEYQVFLDFYERLARPDFVYDEEITQWIDSNRADLDAIHSFVGDECDIQLGSPDTTLPA